jgi:predicted nucleic acid-binding protein
MKLVDTDFLIDLQREWASESPGPAVAFLQLHQGTALAVSTVSVLEFLEGYEHPAAGERLLEAYSRLPVTDGVARRGSRLRRSLRAEGRMIGDFDVLIAATALDAGIPLVTANTTHFQRVEGLTVEPYRAATSPQSEPRRSD